MRLRLEDLPPALRAQALRQTNAAGAPRGFEGQGAALTRPGHSDAAQRPSRSPTRGLNKTEERFLRDWPPGSSGLILAQALVLPFGDGTSYRPDFVLIGDRVTAYEVKGGHVGKVAWSRHGIERFRRAREKFREIGFELWQWDGKRWERKLEQN